MIGGHGNIQGPGNFHGPELLAVPGKFQDPGYFQAPWKIPGGSLSPVRHAVQRWSPRPTIGGAIQVYLGGTPGLAIDRAVRCAIVKLATVVLEREYARLVLDAGTGRVDLLR